MLAKIYSWVRLVQKVELTTMVGIFMGNKVNLKLYDCKIVNMLISDGELAQKIGFGPQGN